MAIPFGVNDTVAGRELPWIPKLDRCFKVGGHQARQYSFSIQDSEHIGTLESLHPKGRAILLSTPDHIYVFSVTSLRKKADSSSPLMKHWESHWIEESQPFFDSITPSE
jgi:hypothetical protein